MNSSLLLGLLLVANVQVAAADKPEGWFLAGSDPKSYSMDVDPKVGHNSKTSGRLMSTGQPKGFGTMMQTFEAAQHLGKRLRYSAWVKASKVNDWAGLWMRVDGKDRPNTLSFDNMQDRPIKGTSDWKQYAIVLDVPEDSKAIAFGILVSGPGTVWIDDISFEVVDASVPTTGQSGKPKPANLNFEK